MHSYARQALCIRYSLETGSERGELTALEISDFILLKEPLRVVTVADE